MTTYKIDPSHSEITFKVKHLVISTVTGSFLKFDGSVTQNNDDFTDANIDFEADVSSLTTSNEQRDGHLKSPDFFDAAQFPKITFKSTSFKKAGDDDYTLTGDMTMHGVTKPVSLDVTHGGQANDMYGNTREGFEITGKLNRKEFGLSWSGLTNAGGAILSDEIKLNMNVQLIKQA